MSINISNRYAVQCHSLTFCDICHVEYAQNHKHPGAFPLNSVMFWFDYQFVKDCYEYCLTRPKLDQNWYGTIFLNNFSKLRYRDFFSKLYKTNTETHFPRMIFFETATKWGHWGRRGGMGLTIAVELFLDTHLLSLIILESWGEVPYFPFLSFHIHFLCDFVTVIEKFVKGLLSVSDWQYQAMIGLEFDKKRRRWQSQSILASGDICPSLYCRAVTV